MAQRQCWCRPTNRQRLKLSLAPLSSPRTHNAEDDYWARNVDGVRTSTSCIQNSSSYISHGPQIRNVDQLKMFNFDAIQVMEDTELAQLPEAVNREILKNSQEITFGEEEEILRRNPIGLYRQRDKIFRNDWEIRFEEGEEDISVQNTMKRDLNEERNRILKNREEIVFKTEEERFLKKDLIGLDKTNGDIPKNSQEIVFKKEKKDSLRRNVLRSTEEENNSLQEQDNQEFALEEEERELLEKNVDMERGDILTFLKQRVLERNPIRLDLKNTSEMYEEEEFPLVTGEENHGDVENNLQELRRRYETRNKELVREDHEMCLKRLGVHDQRCQIVPEHRYQKNVRRYLFLNEERKSSSGLNRSFSDNPFVVNNRRSLRESRRNAISQPIVAINQDQKKLKKYSSLNEEPFSRDFNNDLIDDPFAVDDRRSIGESGRDAITGQDYKISIEEELEAYKSVHLQNKGQKPLKEFNMSVVNDIFMINDRKLFRESRRNTINNVKNIRVLEEGRKSSQRSTKYLSTTLDNSVDNSMSWQRSNYFNFPARENDNDEIERHDDVEFESEKMPKRSSSGHLVKIAIQRKFRPSDSHLSVTPVFDLSPESGFCEESLFNLSAEYGRTEPRSIARNKSRDVDEVKGNNSW